MIYRIILSMAIGCIPLSQIVSQNTFYRIDSVQTIEIFFSQPNWDYQLDTAKHGKDGYIIAEWVKINGQQFNTVGVKYKGNSSYDSTYRKNPLHIELDHVVSQSYQGVKDIKLSNCFADPSMIREVLSYHILKNYMICPRANFAKVFINGGYIGLYANTESIGKTFCTREFGISGQTFIKCNPLNNPSPYTKSNLKFIPGADSSAYFNLYEIKSNYGWNRLVELCDVITNDPSEAAEVLDIDRVLWMLAYNMVLVNLDSYTGVFCQNYYLYRDADQRYNPIVWDLNMSFGGFPFVGNSNTSMGALTIANMKQLPPTIHATDPHWPLINIVMNNSAFRKEYYAHIRTILSDFFVNNAYIPVALQLQQLIDSAVQADTNKFFSYNHFVNGLTQDFQVLNYQVPGLSNLMSARTPYLLSHPEIAAQPPLISQVTPVEPSPLYNSTITIRAQVQNATQVILGYRLKTSGRFSYSTMYDDGLHNDLLAGDGIFGVQFQLGGLQLHYFVKAYNSQAAAFMPQKAEYNYFALQATMATPQPGEVTINEFLAKNNSGLMSEYGEFADWIELYNNTNQTMSLFGLFLTDNATNLTKWAFPEHSIIAPKSYMLIIADEKPSTSQYLHCNFKLSADGEAILLSNGSRIMIDQVTFGPQTADVSMGRCPNGTGEFGFIDPPTPAATNCALHVDNTGLQHLNVFPNPAREYFLISGLHENHFIRLQVIRPDGTTAKNFFKPESEVFSIKGLPPGLYILIATHATGSQATGKLVVQ